MTKYATTIEILTWLLSQRDPNWIALYVKDLEEKAFSKGLAWGLACGLILNVLLWLAQRQ